MGAQAGTSDEARVRQLIEVLQDAYHPRRRTEAAMELGSAGASAGAAVPALLKATADESPFQLRDEAIKALGAIAPDDPAVLERIAELLADRSERGEISATARMTLTQIGSAAIPVLTEKLEAQWDEHGEAEVLGTWGWAAFALGEIGCPALPAVLSAFAEPRKRMGAAEALRVMGSPVAGEAVPVLIAHASDDDSHVRCSVYSALEAMGPAASPAVPALVEGLDDTARMCAEKAARALGAIGPAAHEALPALDRQVHNTGSAAARRAILRIRGQ
jgi:HEAT repeat protein